MLSVSAEIWFHTAVIHFTVVFVSADSPYHDVSGLPDPYMDQLDCDDSKPQHISLSFDESLESGYSTPNSRSRRVIREIIVWTYFSFETMCLTQNHVQGYKKTLKLFERKTDLWHCVIDCVWFVQVCTCMVAILDTPYLWKYWNESL